MGKIYFPNNIEGCYKKQNDTNKKILEKLIERNDENETSSEENKQHIDDMLKMREMYESD